MRNRLKRRETSPFFALFYVIHPNPNHSLSRLSRRSDQDTPSSCDWNERVGRFRRNRRLRREEGAVPFAGRNPAGRVGSCVRPGCFLRCRRGRGHESSDPCSVLKSTRSDALPPRGSQSSPNPAGFRPAKGIPQLHRRATRRDRFSARLFPIGIPPTLATPCHALTRGQVKRIFFIFPAFFRSVSQKSASIPSKGGPARLKCQVFEVKTTKTGPKPRWVWQPGGNPFHSALKRS